MRNFLTLFQYFLYFLRFARVISKNKIIYFHFVCMSFVTVYICICCQKSMIKTHFKDKQKIVADFFDKPKMTIICLYEDYIVTALFFLSSLLVLS